MRWDAHKTVHTFEDGSALQWPPDFEPDGSHEDYKFNVVTKMDGPRDSMAAKFFRSEIDRHVAAMERMRDQTFGKGPVCGDCQTDLIDNGSCLVCSPRPKCRACGGHRNCNGKCQKCGEVSVVGGFDKSGIKNDAGKTRPSLLPPKALLAASRAFTKGLELPGRVPGDWEKVKPATRYLDATLRHLLAHMEGKTDEPHLAQALASLMILVHFDESGEKTNHVNV